MTDTISTILFQGTEYPAAMFSDQVRQLLQLAVDWNDELRRAHSQVKMAEVALDALNKQLKEQVAKELQQ